MKYVTCICYTFPSALQSPPPPYSLIRNSYQINQLDNTYKTLLFVCTFYLPLRAAQNAVQLVKILSNTIHQNV